MRGKKYTAKEKQKALNLWLVERRDIDWVGIIL